MKNFLIALLLLFCADVVFSQRISPRRIRKHRARVYESRIKGTVTLSLDTIYNKGRPYAILHEKKQLPYNDYQLCSLDNRLLISIHSGTGVRDRTLYFAFYFVESKKTGEPEKYFGFNIEKAVVSFDLVHGDEINPYGEFEFLKKYPRQFSDPYYVKYIDENPVNTPNIYEIVKRDRDKQVYIRDGKIQQDYKLIGNYKENDEGWRFYLPDHIIVAEVNRKEPGSTTWLINTLKDEKNWSINTNDENALKDIVQFLLEKQYL